MIATIVIRREDGVEDELVGNTIKVLKNGSLMVYNETISAKTTTTVSERFLSGPKTTTETEITRKSYITATYASGRWTSVYAKVTKVDPKVHNEPFN